MFTDKVLLITGGTGSFGTEVLNKFLNTDIKEIRVFSRDEKKQDDLRKKYNNNKLKFYIGDVRDYRSIDNAMKGVDFVFHAAALKQVHTCEFYPMEAVKTNILGTENVLDAAISNGVKKVIVLSTDKAVYPVNAMGMSKALMEKIAIAKAREQDNTIICRTRYGNVLGSRGSVVPLFCNQIENNQSITITNPDMTRFMMSLEEAVDLVLYAFKNGKQGDLFVQKSSAVTINTLAKAIKSIMKSKVQIKYIGSRHGEKINEVLITKEEMINVEDLGRYYRVPMDSRTLNYEECRKDILDKEIKIQEYNSSNTKILNLQETKEMLKKIRLF